MIKKGTGEIYSLRAVEPRSRRLLIESYATSDEAATRRAALEPAGYTVIVTLAETGGDERPARGRKPPWWYKGRHS